MAELKINEVSAKVVEAGQRLYLDASGEKVVAEGSVDAASLYAIEGDQIDRADAVRLGLVKAKAADKKAAAKADDDD